MDEILRSRRLTEEIMRRAAAIQGHMDDVQTRMENMRVLEQSSSRRSITSKHAGGSAAAEPTAVPIASLSQLPDDVVCCIAGCLHDARNLCALASDKLALPLTVFWQTEQRRAIAAGEEQAHEGLRLFSVRVVQQVDDWTALNLSVMKLAASLPDVVSNDPLARRQVITLTMRQLPWAYLIHALDLTGMDVARSDASPNISYEQRDYVRRIREGAPYDAEVRIGITSQKPAFLLSVPLHDASGKLRGVLDEAATLDEVSKAVTSASLGKTGFAFLLTPSGQLIASAHESSGQDLNDDRAHPAFVAAQADHLGIQHYTLDGIERVAIIQRTPLGWIAVVQQDVSENMAGVIQAKQYVLIVLGITAALVSLLSFLVARGFAIPIEQVTAVADQISRGQLDFRIVTTRDVRFGDSHCSRRRQLVYHYFASKERLFACVLDESADKVTSELLALELDHLAPPMALRTFLCFAFDQYRSDPALGPLAQQGLRYHEDHATQRSRFPDLAPALGAQMARLLQRGVDSGDFRPHVDARLFHAAASAAAETHTVGGKALPPLMVAPDFLFPLRALMVARALPFGCRVLEISLSFGRSADDSSGSSGSGCSRVHGPTSCVSVCGGGDVIDEVTGTCIPFQVGGTVNLATREWSMTRSNALLGNTLLYQGYCDLHGAWGSYSTSKAQGSAASFVISQQRAPRVFRCDQPPPHPYLLFGMSDP
ncbi:MAG: hypothetical protein WDW38_007989 [Sanguina aurantia]